MPVSQLTGSLEDNVLTLLCWDKTHCHTIALRVPVELYSTRAYRRIAEQAVEYIASYSKPPRAHLRDLLEDELRRGEEGRFLSQILDAMEGLRAELQPEFVLEQLEKFIKQRRLIMSTSLALDNLHSGDIEAAEEALNEVRSAPLTAASSWLGDTNDWFSFLQEDETAQFSSGIDELDRRGVTPRRGALFLVIGTSGSGKSWWLTEIGKRNFVENRHNVLHITLENDLDDVKQRYTQSFLARTASEVAQIRVPVFERDQLGRFVKLNFSNIMPDTVAAATRADLASQLRRFTGKGRGRMLCQWFPTGMLTAAQLSSNLDVLERQEGFRPDLLIIDYLDLMHTDARDLRISTGRLTRELRAVAGQRDLALVTATQGNRYSSTARTVGSNMVAEDWSKIGTADTVCTYSQTIDEKDIGVARILVAKARRVRDKWIALITQSYETGQFCIDSCYFNKLVEAEIFRMTGREEEEGEKQ